MARVHVGVAHHLGWAVLVTATADHRVVDRRRVELVADDLPAAPIHHRSGVHPMHLDGDPLDDGSLAQLAAEVRRSAVELTSAAFDSLLDDLDDLGELGALDDLDRSVASVSVRAWPPDFPTDIATLRRAPYESQADSVLYRQVIAEHAERRGWPVHLFDARTIESAAAELLGGDELLTGQRRLLGAPWNADHRIAFAATIVASATPRS